MPTFGHLLSDLGFATLLSRVCELLFGNLSLLEVVGIEIYVQLLQFNRRTSPIHTVMFTVPSQHIRAAKLFEPRHR